jgi:hypothetical protein
LKRRHLVQILHPQPQGGPARSSSAASPCLAPLRRDKLAARRSGARRGAPAAWSRKPEYNAALQQLSRGGPAAGTPQGWSYRAPAPGVVAMWRPTSKWPTAPAPRRMEGPTVAAPCRLRWSSGKAC